MSRVAVYPGTFDPVTLGHVDLMRRASALFDEVVVAVLLNTEKVPVFTAEERAAMLREATGDLENVEVALFDGLLVDFARSRNARVVLRGLRAISDFEYELQMAMMNRRLHPDLETVFMTPGEDFSYLSSRLVREVARLGGAVDELVPPVAAEALRAHFGKGR
jgi:pantetheine-phosphate adenylyltransferase